MNNSVKNNGHTIVYVTREIERALGIDPGPGYRVVANRTPYGEEVRKRFPAFVTLIDVPAEKTGHLPSTADLIAHPDMAKVMKDLEAQNPVLIVFKNSARIEAAAAASTWSVLNPPASLADRIENKITQVAWLGELGAKYLPPHNIQSTRSIRFDKDPFIVQWAHSHTGGGTMLVQSAAGLAKIQEKFPDRLARVTSYVNGPSFTVNAVVAGKRILIGNISYQVTGLAPFTENEFTTIGNDWSITHSLLSESEVEYIHKMAAEIGGKLRESGWKGLFGIDCIRDEEHGRIYLIEVNARQPASTTLESLFQKANRGHGLSGSLIFEAHLESLLGRDDARALIEINDGAQVVQRVTSKIKNVPVEISSKLEGAGYATVAYGNTDNNADLLRIQSAKGLMEGHQKWNSRGKEIIATLEGTN